MLPNDDLMMIAYDTKLMKPGCAIIQSGLGGTPGIAGHFDSRLWLTAPTPNMKVYPVTPEMLKELVRKTEETHAEPVENPEEQH